MKPHRDEYSALKQAAHKCREVFLQQNAANFEQAASSLLHLYQQQVQRAPICQSLMLNTCDSELDWFSGLLLSQIAISSYFHERLHYQRKVTCSNSLAGLLILFTLTPAIVAAKRQKDKKLQLKQHLHTANNKAFAIGKRIQLQDQECLKLLSLLAGKNRYYNCNQLSQALLLLSINSNFIAHLAVFNETCDLTTAVTRQLTCPNLSPLPNRHLPNVLLQLQILLHPSIKSGGIVLDNKQRKLLLITPVTIDKDTPDDTWLCFNLTGNANSTFELLAAQNIRQFIGKQKVNILRLLQRLQLADIDNSPLSLKQVTQLSKQLQLSQSKTTTQQEALIYQAPEHWRATAKSLLLEDPNKLAVALDEADKHGEYRRTLWTYAQQLSRENLAIKDSKHAINMIGSERVFPVILNAALMKQQTSIRLNGSDIVYQKNQLFCQLTHQLTKVKQAGTVRLSAENMEVIARVIFLALMSIPKARFAAASQINPLFAVNNQQAQQPLSSLYKLSDPTPWFKICAHLANSWCMPKSHKAVLNAFFASILQKKQVSAEVAILQNASFIFIMLTQQGYISAKHLPQVTQEHISSIDDMLQAPEQAALHSEFLNNLPLYTPLT